MALFVRLVLPILSVGYFFEFGLSERLSISFLFAFRKAAHRPPASLSRSVSQLAAASRVTADVSQTHGAQESQKSSARLVAAAALAGTTRSSPFSLQKLESDPAYRSLKDPRDRAFARLLVTTVERRMGQIDIVLDQVHNKGSRPKKGGKADAFVRASLRLGAAQLLFLDVPPYAAVKETIDVLRSPDIGCKVPEPKIKYVNALLRRIGREGAELLAEHTSPMDNIAPWLLEEWRNDWGDDSVETISKSFMRQSSIDLTVNYFQLDCQSEQDHRAAQERVRDAFGGNTTILPHGSVRVSSDISGAVSSWPLYREGAWWVQDASAALPALALHNVLSINEVSNLRDAHVVDLCAAPGGKTAQLISLGFENVTALEISERRSRRLLENLDRLQMRDRCEVCVADGTEWIPPVPVHGALLDVPCSATGTGRKRPDVLRRDVNLGNLLEVQEKLANHCADFVLAPGGIMVYATCSILKQESEDQVSKLLDRTDGADLETIPFTPGEIQGFDSAIDRQGWLRVLPGCLPGRLSTCDGFFVARLRKRC